MKCMQNSKTHLGVMFGGTSAEHEISIITALQAIRAIDPCKYDIIPIYLTQAGKWYTGENLLEKKFYQNMPDTLSCAQEVTLLPDPSIGGLTPLNKNTKPIKLDVCLLAFHGQFGEDGSVQGLLELAGIPYTGCGVAASAVAMDKYQCKMFYKAHNIPVLPAIAISKEDSIRDFRSVIHNILSHPGLEKFPLFVKPNSLGSSIGISKAENKQELASALAKVFTYDSIALVEPCLSPIIEINISVLEGDHPIASAVEIPVPDKNGALTFEDKYLRGGSKKSKSEGMASLTRIIDPPDLDQDIKSKVTKYALQGFSLLRCSGVVRFDFMLDLATGNLYFNELNPIPGSLSFYLWEKSTPPILYTEIIDRLINGALKRNHMQLSLKRDLGFKAL